MKKLVIFLFCLSLLGQSNQPFTVFIGDYATNKKELGNPHNQVTTTGSYQAWHEKATVIWSKQLEAFYLLNTETNKWYKVHDPYANDSTQGNERFYDDVQLRSTFNNVIIGKRGGRLVGLDDSHKLPNHLYPPWAGIAKLWLNNNGIEVTSWVDAIGWRKSHCELDPKLIFFQEFDDGVMIGPIRIGATNDFDNTGWIVTLIHDKTWKFTLTQINPVSPCSVPYGKTTIN